MNYVMVYLKMIEKRNLFSFFFFLKSYNKIGELMTIRFIDNLSFNVYLKKEIMGSMNIKNKVEIEKYLKKLITKLKDLYNITIEGFYDVNIYVDKYYGIIINFKKEKLDYYDYFNGIEFNIDIKETSFLYMVDDIPISLLDKLEIKQINNDIYLKLKKDLSQKDFMNLMEHAEKIIKV